MHQFWLFHAIFSKARPRSSHIPTFSDSLGLFLSRCGVDAWPKGHDMTWRKIWGTQNGQFMVKSGEIRHSQILYGTS